MQGCPWRTVFESLRDPLAAQRRGQPLGRRLTRVFWARVSGENSERGLAAWMAEQRWRLQGGLGFRREDVPSYRPIQRALPRVDAQELASKGGARELPQARPRTAWEGLALAGERWPGSDDGVHRVKAGWGARRMKFLKSGRSGRN